jgi:hypothetical protein
MVGDFFTKPFQGALFYKLRAIILNIPSPESGDSPLSQAARPTTSSAQHTTVSVSQECVGDWG